MKINMQWEYRKPNQGAEELSIGTSYRLTLPNINAKHMQLLFGKSIPITHEKGTYMYVFENAEGQVATIYDYYDDNGHVGARTNEIAEAFARWFSQTF